jgi:hypothetical protein
VGEGKFPGLTNLAKTFVEEMNVAGLDMGAEGLHVHIEEFTKFILGEGDPAGVRDPDGFGDHVIENPSCLLSPPLLTEMVDLERVDPVQLVLQILRARMRVIVGDKSSFDWPKGRGRRRKWVGCW